MPDTMPYVITARINAWHTTGECLNCSNDRKLIKNTEKRLETIMIFVDKRLGFTKNIGINKKKKRRKIGRI